VDSHPLCDLSSDLSLAPAFGLGARNKQRTKVHDFNRNERFQACILCAPIPLTCINVSLYVDPEFEQINHQSRESIYNPMECIRGADTGAGTKLAEL